MANRTTEVLKIAEPYNTADELFIEQFGSHPISFDQLRQDRNNNNFIMKIGFYTELSDFLLLRTFFIQVQYSTAS